MDHLASQTLGKKESKESIEILPKTPHTKIITEIIMDITAPPNSAPQNGFVENLPNEPEKKTSGIATWAIIGAFVLTLMVYFWGLLYSSYFANLSFVVPLRKWYQIEYWRARALIQTKERAYPPFSPIYTVQAIEPVKGGASYYQFLGKYDSFDHSSNLVYLKGYDGKSYTFYLDPKTFVVNNNFLTLTELATTANPSALPAVVGVFNDLPLTNDSIFVIQWDDKRSLLQINNDHIKSPSTPLNQSATQIFFVTKIN